jgi:serine/threonine protein kinase/Flp pilus assembly protein TadD
MSKRSIFGLEPDQLDQLLSLGADAEGQLTECGPDAEAQEDGEAAGDTTSDQELSGENMTAEGMPPTERLASVERVGDWVGSYKLLRVLGEGGMGIVYLAEQAEPIKRRVGLKVIKPGMDSKRVIARFEAERQALALLDHPNIARVHDAGTTEAGRPYFAMEHVQGLPITEYCDRHKLSIEDRLRLFRQVCLAVHHAHQKGIIHRDLKPSNILVSAEADTAIPKIIDFGVAKAISQPLTERTLLTEDSQLLGTPEYMSPEQADMAGEDIDTRSDIYSLGVLLYVLLTGALPFDSDTLRTGGIEHIRQVIRETDPKTPSTRLTKLGDEARKLAESRRTEVAALARRLHRELEWIPLKAMRKDRAERYRSASELADDIENYLHEAPLIAGPLGPGYRLKKFVRRNRVLVGGIAAVLLVLLAGVVVSTIFAIRAERARTEAQLVADFLENDVLASANEASVDEATVGYTLDAASQSLVAGKFKDKPLVEARIRCTLGSTYRRLGEYEKAEQHILRAIEIYRHHHGEEHPDTLEAIATLGWLYNQEGRHDEMERLFTEILQVGQHIWSVEDQLHTMNGLGVAYMGQGRTKEAEALFERMLSLDRRELQGEYSRSAPWFRHNLAIVYYQRGRCDEAERILTEMMRTNESPASNLKQSLAGVYAAQGRYDEAEKLFAEALEAFRLLKGDKHPMTLACMQYFAKFHLKQGHYDEAGDLLREALPSAREQLPQGHPRTLTLAHTLAVLYIRQARYEDAEPLLLEAYNGRKAQLGPEHRHTIDSLRQLVSLYESWNKPDEAEKWRAKLPERAGVTQ